MENVPFYNVKKPMIRFTYFESGQKRYREEQFRVMTAQNISPSTGFNVNYKSRGTRGKYPRSRTKNHNFSGAVNHTGKSATRSMRPTSTTASRRRRTAAWWATGPSPTRRSR